MEIRVHIEAPELSAAVLALAGALGKEKPATQLEKTDEPAEAKLTIVREVEDEIPANKVDPDPEWADKETATPTDEDPKWTFEQLARAGSKLVSSGKRAEVVDLLNSIGVKSIAQADASLYNTIGAELIKLGAEL